MDGVSLCGRLNVELEHYSIAGGAVGTAIVSSPVQIACRVANHACVRGKPIGAAPIGAAEGVQHRLMPRRVQLEFRLKLATPIESGHCGWKEND